jgi:hypothetical protein
MEMNWGIKKALREQPHIKRFGFWGLSREGDFAVVTQAILETGVFFARCATGGLGSYSVVDGEN